MPARITPEEYFHNVTGNKHTKSPHRLRVEKLLVGTGAGFLDYLNIKCICGHSELVQPSSLPYAPSTGCPKCGGPTETSALFTTVYERCTRCEPTVPTRFVDVKTPQVSEVLGKKYWYGYGIGELNMLDQELTSWYVYDAPQGNAGTATRLYHPDSKVLRQVTKLVKGGGEFLVEFPAGVEWVYPYVPTGKE